MPASATADSWGVNKVPAAWAAGFFAAGLLVAAFVLPRRDRARGLVDAEPQPLAPGPVAGATAQAAETS